MAAFVVIHSGNSTMPLRDHFRSPIDDTHSWDELHGMWPATMVQHLSKVLPEPYFAAPNVHLGSLFEVDIATFQSSGNEGEAQFHPAQSGAAVAVAAAKPTVTFEPKLPNQDTYEVRIYESRRNRRLVAAIEIVSPSNKDRPEHRDSFVAKVTNLLSHKIWVGIIDVVSTSNFNLYADLMQNLNGIDPALTNEPPSIYVATLRPRQEAQRTLLDAWYEPLAIGHPLPALSIHLREGLAVTLDLEATYEEICQTLRIR